MPDYYTSQQLAQTLGIAKNAGLHTRGRRRTKVWPPGEGMDFACRARTFEVQTICKASRMEARTVGRDFFGPGGGSRVRFCFS